ncbi:MAG TPA: thioesterase [Candidatus Saccharicenans sp.]|nr:thioesterase [Candidatus Saccharicenans sp.]HNT00886.1 thioesterase [Candidatus Saccharicenans sp.]HQO76248.1 thioesterase [Candidatus Saccharicenans sp.]
MDRQHEYQTDYEIMSFNVDYQNRAHLSALMNYLQDAARLHSIAEKFSVFDLQAKGVTWVISRYHLQVQRYPEMGEIIAVKTWASGKHSFYALREFEISDARQKRILAATSSWMIIDLKDRRPVKINDFFPDELILNKRLIEDDFPVLPVVERLNFKSNFKAWFEDLDFNRHVNNVAYSRWAVESLPPEVLFSRRPVEIEINYRSEVFYGDTIEVITQRPLNENEEWIQQIFNLSTGKEVARLRSAWR